MSDNSDMENEVLAELEDKTTPIREAIEARNRRKIDPKVWYWVREYSESECFPEVHIFTSEEEARRTMITEALEAAAFLGGEVTEDMDGSSITACLQNGWGNFHQRVTSLNVQREGGAVDCFRLMAQEVRS